jgi:acyl-CoA thioesterase I
LCFHRQHRKAPKMIRTVVITIVWIVLSFASQQQHAAAQTIPPAPHAYLAVGDSLTVGLYATDNYGFARLVADRLPAGSTFEVAAVTGAGIENTLKQVPVELADHHPDIVTVEVGINNLGTMNASQFAVNYLRLLDRIAADAPGALVVACTVPWTGQIPSSTAYARALEFNGVITTAATAHGYLVAPCWDALLWHYEYLSDRDGFHPNDDGHAALADAVWSMLGPALETRQPRWQLYIPALRGS